MTFIAPLLSHVNWPMHGVVELSIKDDTRYSSDPNLKLQFKKDWQIIFINPECLLIGLGVLNTSPIHDR